MPFRSAITDYYTYIYSADIDVYQVYIHVYISNVIKYKYITLPDITIHYITLHYVTFCYITLHYMTLHDTTWHYTTLHIFNRIYYTHNQWDTSRWNLGLWPFSRCSARAPGFIWSNLVPIVAGMYINIYPGSFPYWNSVYQWKCLWEKVTKKNVLLHVTPHDPCQMSQQQRF